VCQEKIKVISSWHTGSTGRVGATRSRRKASRHFPGGKLCPKRTTKGTCGSPPPSAASPPRRPSSRDRRFARRGVPLLLRAGFFGLTRFVRLRWISGTSSPSTASSKDRPQRVETRRGSVVCPALPHPRFFLCFKERNEGLKIFMMSRIQNFFYFYFTQPAPVRVCVRVKG